jgi:hypothetical protein
VRTLSGVQSGLPSLFCNRGRCKRHPRCGRRPRPAVLDRHRRRKSRNSPRVEARCRSPTQELCLQGAKIPSFVLAEPQLKSEISLHMLVLQNTTDRSALRLAREAESFGGVLSASHGREHLALTAAFLKGDESVVNCRFSLTEILITFFYSIGHILLTCWQAYLQNLAIPPTNVPRVCCPQCTRRPQRRRTTQQ